jgi:hypothetical protein
VQHDLQLRAAARAIYDVCFRADDGARFSFDQAERYGTDHYRQAIGAAQQARSVLNSQDEQLTLPAFA